MTGQAQSGLGGQGLRIAVWGGAAALILAAAAAARLTEAMRWETFDFLLFGAVLLAACGLFELLMRRTGSWAYRAAALIAVAAALLTLLAAGAVGIVGSEDEPANLLFLGAIAVAAAGALAARLRPRGMARAMAAAAAAHVLAGVAAVILVPDMTGFLLGTALFTPMWLASAWLFGRAAR